MRINRVLLATLACVGFIGCASPGKQADIIEWKHYGDWEKDIGYTQVVRVGNTLYLAGLGGQGKTQAEQLKSTYQNINAILAEYKASTNNIVKEVIYTTNMDELIAAKDERKKYFSNGRYPASSWVQIERLYLPDMKIEIDVTVQIPE